MFEEGIGAAVVSSPARSTCPWYSRTPKPARGPCGRRPPRRVSTILRRWLAAVVVPSAVCAFLVFVLDPFLDSRRRERDVLCRRACSSRCSAASRRLRCLPMLSGLLPQLLLDRAAHTLYIARPDNAITKLSWCSPLPSRSRHSVDSAAKRHAREARARASQEAELLALFAGSVLRGADLDTLLERVRETYSQQP